MYPHFFPPLRQQPNAGLIEDIAKAINGEYSAVTCYQQLAQLAPNEKTRHRILEIRKDEIRHFQMFSRIYMTLTGRQPQPQLTERCPTIYREGLRAAFQDEQETVDFYHEMADRAHHPFIKKQLRRAAFDEQNHAVWFLALDTMT